MDQDNDKSNNNLNKDYYLKNELYNEHGEMLIDNENKNDEENNIKEIYTSFNIGKNIIYKNKYVFGIKGHLCQMISLILFFFMIYIIFIFFIFPYFYYNKSFILYSLIYIITTSSFMLGLYSQLTCFFTEPGIIPRKFPKYKSQNLSDKYILSKITKKPIIKIQRKCNVCLIKRPRKCQHCYFCDNCIEEFDHHCQYTSNCIGKRNKKYFYFFIFFDLIFLIQIYIIAIIQFCLVFMDYSIDILKIYNYISITIILIGIMLILMLCNLFFYYGNTNKLLCILFCFNIFFIISFYYSKSINSNSLPLYVSPFNIVLINISFKRAYYFLMQFIHHLNMIAFNMTSFEYRNLLNYMKIMNKEQSYAKLPNDDSGENINNRLDDDSIKNYNTPCTVMKDVPSKKEMPIFSINELIKNIKNLILKKNPTSLLYQ